MRPRMVLAVVWLIATAVATTVGFTATHTVGDVIGGTGPVGAEYRPVSEPPSEHLTGSGSARTETFHFEVGRLTVRCEGHLTSLVAKRPAPGWRVTDSESGPDEDVDVSFTGGGTTTRIEVYCNEGTPRPVVSHPVPQSGSVTP